MRGKRHFEMTRDVSQLEREVHRRAEYLDGTLPSGADAPVFDLEDVGEVGIEFDFK